VEEEEGRRAGEERQEVGRLGDYASGLDEGWKQYESIWKKWKGPDARR